MPPPDMNSPLASHDLRTVFKIADELIVCASEDEILGGPRFQTSGSLK